MCERLTGCSNFGIGRGSCRSLVGSRRGNLRDDRDNEKRKEFQHLSSVWAGRDRRGGGEGEREVDSPTAVSLSSAVLCASESEPHPSQCHWGRGHGKRGGGGGDSISRGL